MDAFENRIIAVVADELGITEAEVTPDSRFAEDHGLDAFDVSALLLRLAEETEVFLPADDVEAIKSVRDLIDAVRELAEPQTT